MSDIIPFNPGAVVSERDTIKKYWQRSAHGIPIDNLYNAYLFLSKDEETRNLLAFDEFSGRIITRGRLPGSSEKLVDEPFVKNRHVTPIQGFLQEQGLQRVGYETVYQAVIQLAYKHKVNLLCDHLNALEWDQEPRLDTWAATYFGVIDCEYSRLVSAWYIISAVARAYDPGCKVDTMLTLHGPQGIFKSEFGRVLAGRREWFSSSMPSLKNVGDKEALQSMCGKWIIELAELAQFKGASPEAIKDFLTSEADYFRKPYDVTPLDYLRTCVFYGTLNVEEVIKDATGLRRFLPLIVDKDKVDIAEFKCDRDQIVAEAVYRYLHGEKWWPQTEHQKLLCETEQKKFNGVVEDPWAEPVRQWLIKKLYNGFMATRAKVKKQMSFVYSECEVDACLARGEGEFKFKGAEALTGCIGLEVRYQSKKEVDRMGKDVFRDLDLKRDRTRTWYVPHDNQIWIEAHDYYLGVRQKPAWLLGG
jgi:predicted P-loop ATPase